MLLFAPLVAQAAPLEVPPPHRLASWTGTLTTPTGGNRVGMIVVATDTAPLTVEVWDGTSWIRATEARQVHDTHVLSAPLGHHVASIRLRSPDAARIRSVDWDLFTPNPEPRGPPQGESRASLPAELTAIGVVSRTGWGAEDTTCSSLEDDWYRMAIHHTAGSQTYGGTVMGAVQVLQSYSLSTGEYCDIPYQFLVGYDGTLYEGRPYGYTSGATGGGNNDGNIAVCFLGCYHPSDCPDGAGDPATDTMIDGGQLLVQTLAALHAVPSDSDSIRGHRDWPDNSTACPGDYVYARLGELMEPLGPDYAATLVSSSFGTNLSLAVGDAYSGNFTLQNTGRQTWTPGITNLGTLPRDTPSVLEDPSWISNIRPATVDASTAPGETGVFQFQITAGAVGEVDASFGLVQDGVVWFADDGGPADGTLTFHLSITAAETQDSDPPPSDTHDSGRPTTPGDAPGTAVSFQELGGCGCASPIAPAWGGLLLAMGALRRFTRGSGARP